MRRSPFPTARHARTTAGVALALAVGLTLTACGGGGKNAAKGNTTETTSSTAPDKVQGSVASYDLAVGPPARFILGIYNEAKGPVGYGTVPFSFFFLGANSASGTPQPGPTATATYLPLPGSPPPPADTSKPVYLPTSERGVYAADVAFDKPGYWGVSATLDLGGPQKVSTPFKVQPKHAVPAPGDAAIPSQNLTISTPGAPPEAIDSRASATTPVPDPELHQTTVAQALREKRPVVLVISTPTYCVSLFCGPVTDMVAGLAKDYANRARFIHIEVWKDYKAQQLNDAAKEWIARGEDINEPWVFLIGADGKITARFDNVVTRSELEPLIQKLPPKA
ncbi:MAG TPA: hypothetical protein VJ622_17295 [Acidimicrobiia bacterium]|nr:hypothetical protein [Acidimicrobiia bacterium]